MNAEEFQKSLAQKGSYSTDPDAKRSLLDKFLGWLDAWFYWSSFQIVQKSARFAKKGLYDDKQWALSSFGILRSIERCGGRVEISGYENVMEKTTPCVYVANHMSIIETFLLPVILIPFSHLTIVVKESLINYPVFGHIMRAVKPISVGRTDPRADLKAIIEGGCESIKRGESVLVFPQSTRSLEMDPKTFNSIGIKLGKKAGADVIPIAVKTDFLGIGKVMRDFGRVDRKKVIHIEFGKRIQVQGKGKEEHQKVLDFILQKIHKWSEEENRDT